MGKLQSVSTNFHTGLLIHIYFPHEPKTKFGKFPPRHPPIPISFLFFKDIKFNEDNVIELQRKHEHVLPLHPPQSHSNLQHFHLKLYSFSKIYIPRNLKRLEFQENNKIKWVYSVLSSVQSNKVLSGEQNFKIHKVSFLSFDSISEIVISVY